MVEKINEKIRHYYYVPLIILLLIGVYLLITFSCSDDNGNENSKENTNDLCHDTLDNDKDGNADCKDFDCMQFCNINDGGNDTKLSDIEEDGGVDVYIDTENDNKVDIIDSGQEDILQEYKCNNDNDCVVAVNMLECCRGYTHNYNGSEQRCASAVHKELETRSECVELYDGNNMPSIPETCKPYCDILICSDSTPEGCRVQNGESLCNQRCEEVPENCKTYCTILNCGVCANPTKAVCRDQQCVPYYDCADDSDCNTGKCLDTDGTGYLKCVTDQQDECTEDENCNTESCQNCRCDDFDNDYFKECQCFCEDDGGVVENCVSDTVCPPFNFCEDSKCVDHRPDCRLNVGNIDCSELPECQTPDGGTPKICDCRYQEGLPQNHGRCVELSL